METITSYFKYAIKNKLLSERSFIIALFTLPRNNEFVKVKDNLVSVLLDGKFVPIKGAKVTTSIFDYSKEIVLLPEDMTIVEKETVTTIGVAFLNYVYLEVGLNQKLPFNHDISMNAIEEIIAPILRDNIDDIEKMVNDKSTIYVSDLLKLNFSASYIRSMSQLFVVSATPKTFTPAKGMKEFRAKAIKEMKAKHGKDAMKDPKRVIEVEAELKKFDLEFLKDDPTVNIVTGGKVLNISRKQLYIMLGIEQGFDNGEMIVVETPLHEGWPLDKEVLTALFNGSRSGSHSKGVETKDSGLEAKNLTRATGGFVIKGEDCGSKKGSPFFVMEGLEKEYVGRWILKNGKKILLETLDLVNKYKVEKNILLRSPQECLAPNNTLCKTCVGVSAAEYETGLVLLASGLGGIFVNENMKKMHGTVLEMIKLHMPDLIE